MSAVITRKICAASILAAALMGCQRDGAKSSSAAPNAPPTTTPSLAAQVPASSPAKQASPDVAAASQPSTQAALPPSDAPESALLSRGLQLYNTQCAACHGAQGLNDPRS
jgi:mono/diheme cytochrome c family protein